ncbi:MAG: nucleotidyltransferase domain-containing protein [Chloroflexi bacterium]|nr:nucleotidyltransferase domain-containing protein [Chloroflexota bacterium]
MNQVVEEHREELTLLCKLYGVRKLELFGSAATDRFDPATSDLDFLVEFGELGHGKYADAYFGLLEALEQLFHRPVDLVVASVIRNPYFLEEIAKTRTLLYAA